MSPSRKVKANLSKLEAANVCNFHFIDGAFLEIKGEKQEQYLVQFIDSRTETVVHQAKIQNNCWTKTLRQYFTPWKINVYNIEQQALLFTHQFDCTQKRVYISIESKALGDTIAWIQSIEEFRVKHRCQVICSTFMNDLFKGLYPKIQFVEPGTVVHNLYAMYRLGWFYDTDGEIDYQKNVKNFRTQPLGESATDILGLPYAGTKPKLKASSIIRPMADAYVCIAIHGTAQAKYWNNATGWQEVVDYLKHKGYQVVLLSREGIEYMGNKAPEGVISIPEGSIHKILHYLRHAKLFIGIGSGLSWLAWASGCPTCLISGFSYPYTEVEDVIRIFPNETVCSGCFNRHQLVSSDWFWCPDHKQTPRMFECTRNITGQQVISAITPLLDGV